MNMRDSPTLHLDKIRLKEQRFYCCSTVNSHSRVFNNENNSCPNLSVKQPLVCMNMMLRLNTMTVLSVCVSVYYNGNMFFFNLFWESRVNTLQAKVSANSLFCFGFSDNKIIYIYIYIFNGMY